jgi:hypothetical protein
MSAHSGEPPARLVVLTDERGNIIGASISPGQRSGNAPSETRIIPARGQSLQEVPVPDELRERLENLHEFRLHIDADQAKLVRRQD